MAFDILELNGEDLRDQPYATRKAVLKQFLRGLETLRGAKHIQYTEHSETPRLLFEDLIKRGGEGIILKRLDSSYTEDYRSRNWLKVKLEQKAVCEVAGWTEGNNRRSSSFGSLVLMQNGKYVGNVGGGFSDHELVEIAEHLKGCPSMPKPFLIDEPYTAVKTSMKVLIRYHKRTEANVFRFPSFLKIVPSFFWGEKMEEQILKPQELTIREILSGHMNPTHRGTNMKQLPEYPHVHFINLDHYNKALALAEKLDGEALESFKRSFNTLERICTNSGLTAEVHPDGVPNSFYFITYHKNKADMNGGIILHGQIILR